MSLLGLRLNNNSNYNNDNNNNGNNNGDNNNNNNNNGDNNGDNNSNSNSNNNNKNNNNNNNKNNNISFPYDVVTPDPLLLHIISIRCAKAGVLAFADLLFIFAETQFQQNALKTNRAPSKHHIKYNISMIYEYILPYFVLLRLRHQV